MVLCWAARYDKIVGCGGIVRTLTAEKKVFARQRRLAPVGGCA